MLMNDRTYLRAIGWALLAGTLFGMTAATAEAGEGIVTVELSATSDAREIAPRFLGVSYESRVLLPVEGKYYFDAGDENLVRVYQTLGIKSLRVGANAVDDPRVAVPDTKEIDALFGFARKAGAKVIYSFRLKTGDPANAARLAAYIAKNYSDSLDCFSIGNEPDFYFKTYEPFRDAWKAEYEAIVKAVPDATFDGPATSRKSYALEFADEFFPGGHLAMVSTHTYALGNGRTAEKDPAGSRARFVSNKTLGGYQKLYDGIVKPLEAKKILYRMDETNSCFGGGAKDCSDSYASTLWVLDYLNWWAGKHIQGLNFHTGDTVNGIPPMVANYALFIHKGDGKEFEIRPVSYGCLAFAQVARGKTMDVKVQGAERLDFTAYAYQDGEAGQAVVLLNKSFGATGKAVTVNLHGTAKGRWQSMTIEQAAGDLAAKTGVTLGGSAIDPTGGWEGKWTDVTGESSEGGVRVTVKPASGVLLRVMAGK
jgi:hypothetical protein